MEEKAKGDASVVGEVTTEVLDAKRTAFFDEVNKLHDSHEALRTLEAEKAKVEEDIAAWNQMPEKGSTKLGLKALGSDSGEVAWTQGIAGGDSIKWPGGNSPGNKIKWDDGKDQLGELKKTKEAELQSKTDEIEEDVKVLAKDALYLMGTALKEKHVFNSIQSLTAEFVQWGVKVTRVEYVSYWTSPFELNVGDGPHKSVEDLLTKDAKSWEEYMKAHHGGSSLSEGFSSEGTAQIMKDFAVKVGNNQRWQIDSKSHIVESMMESEHSLKALTGDDCDCSCCADACGAMFKGIWCFLQCWAHSMWYYPYTGATNCCDCCCDGSSSEKKQLDKELASAGRSQEEDEEEEAARTSLIERVMNSSPEAGSLNERVKSSGAYSKHDENGPDTKWEAVPSRSSKELGRDRRSR